jgi:hypothetical protein
LLRLLEGDNKFSRTAGSTNERERGNEMKDLCQFCGWEIARVDWYHRYNNKLICDNCVMDTMSEREREGAL